MALSGNKRIFESGAGLTIIDAETDEEIEELTFYEGALSEEFLDEKVTFDDSTTERNLIKNLDKDDCLFCFQSIEKGGWNFEEFYIDDDDYFDPRKLSFTAQFCFDDVYLSSINYEGKLDEEGNKEDYELTVMDGDSRGVSSNYFFCIDGKIVTFD